MKSTRLDCDTAIRYCGIFLLLLGVSGCRAFLPTKQTQDASVKTSEKIATQQNLSLEAMVRGLAVPGSNGVVILRDFRVEANSAQNAGSQETASHYLKSTLPLGVSLLLNAAGGFAILFLVQAARKRSAAVNAFAGLADHGLAKIAAIVQHQAGEAFRAVESAIESERGKINKQAAKL